MVVDGGSPTADGGSLIADAGLGPLKLGGLGVWPPVLLSPMAGVTNAAYRALCLEQTRAGAGADGAGTAGSGAAGSPGDADTTVPGLYVCEMITSRGIVERIPKTFSMLTFADAETRSVQLYGVEPGVLGEAARILACELGVRHIDLNFGCPVPKVTRRGGGGALPWKLDRFAGIVGATVRAVEPYGVPVTAKIRLGIDDDHLTYLDAGRIAQEQGAAGVILHARTVQQAYGGQADWDAIGTLASHLDIPVIGNGDIWEASDALAMMRQTGCAGVAVGRGCLGRPWLFRDLADAFDGRETQALPSLGEVAAMVYRHAELLVGLRDEHHALADLRKHMTWYFKGFPAGGELRSALAQVSTLDELDGLLARLDPEAPFPRSELGAPRGRQGNQKSKVTLPYGWLDSRTLGGTDISDAETDASGG